MQFGRANAKALELQNQRRGNGSTQWKLVKALMAICAALLLGRSLLGVSPSTDMDFSVDSGLPVTENGLENLLEEKEPKLHHETTKVGSDEPDFHIVILGYKRYSSMLRLLKSLREADYMGDKIALHIHIDGGSGKDWEQSIKVANEAEWSFGPKSVRVAEQNGGLAKAWINAWHPKTDNDRAIILEDDLAVSPVFYRWLKKMYDTYDNRPEIAAYTLQRQRLVASGGSRTVMSIKEPFAYKLLGSWGFAPSAKHWREFLKLDFDKLNPSVPGLITTKWFNRQRRGKMWTQFWIWYCDTHNLYNIYITPPNKKAMATNYREHGVHYGRTRGADFPTLTAAEWVPEWDNPPSELQLYSWSLKPEGISFPPNEEHSSTTSHVPSPIEVEEPESDENEKSTDDADESSVDDSSTPLSEKTDISSSDITDSSLSSEGSTGLDSEGSDDETSENPSSDLTEDDDGASSTDVSLEPVSSKEISDMEHGIDAAKLVLAASNTAKEGIMFLQILNAGFLEITKSWICNVRLMPRVLDRTLFICTDEESFTNLKEFAESSGITLNLHLQVFKSKPELTYGKMSYYWFILFRTSLLETLLRNKINFCLTESDAVWFKDPVSYLLNEMPSDLDIALFHNDLTQNIRMNGGFLWMKSTPFTIEVLQKLYSTMNHRLQVLEKQGKETVNGAGNEQSLFRDLIFRLSRNKNAGQIKKEFLPVNQFSSGLWYGRNNRQFGLNPIILLENWMRGNGSKKHRALKWGHWFLDENNSCLTKFDQVPYPGDSALSVKWDWTDYISMAQKVAFHDNHLGNAVYVFSVESDSLSLAMNFICRLNESSFGKFILEHTIFVSLGNDIHQKLTDFRKGGMYQFNLVLINPLDRKHLSMIRAGLTFKLLRRDITVIRLPRSSIIYSDPLALLGESAKSVDVSIPSTAVKFSADASFYVARPTAASIEHFSTFIMSCQKNAMSGRSGPQSKSAITKIAPLTLGTFQVGRKPSPGATIVNLQDSGPNSITTILRDQNLFRLMPDQLCEG